jgi:hypothetical protein
MDHTALRAAWRRLYRVNPPEKVARSLLMLAVAWKIQEQTYGGLGTATRRHIADLDTAMKRDGDVARSRVRHWRSLSVIAREITGGHWSGPRFFGLNQTTKKPAPAETEETAGA